MGRAAGGSRQGGQERRSGCCLWLISAGFSSESTARPLSAGMCAGKYEDLLGLSLPTAAWPFCDAWKRAEELLQGLPAVPMVCLRPPAPSEAPTAADGKKGVLAAASKPQRRPVPLAGGLVGADAPTQQADTAQAVVTAAS